MLHVTQLIGFGASSSGAAGPITFVGSKTTSANGGGTNTIATTSLSGGLGGDAQIGDFLVVAHGAAATSNQSMSVSGTGLTFTEAAELYADDDADANLCVAYAYCSVAPPSTLDWYVDPTGTPEDRGCVLLVFRNVDSVTPMDAAATTATGTGSGTPNPPAITPATEGACVVTAGTSAWPSGENSGITAHPSGYAGAIVNRETGTQEVGVGASYKLLVTPGVSENPGSYTVDTSASTQSWCAVTLCLRPAS